MHKQIFSITALTVACLMALPALAASSLTPVSDSYEYSISGEEHPTPYLGVDTRDLTPERVTALHLKDEQGVEVTMVDQDAPAGKAGIKEHDVITQVNGENVESVEQLRRLIREIPAGRTVTIGLIRNGQPLAIKAELASRNETFDIHFPEPMNLNLHDLPNVRDWDIPVSVVVVHSALHSGLMIENLNQQLSAYFGVKNGRGILVRSVEKGSLAEKSGFRVGDVIVKVNGTPVSDSSDFSRALRSRKGQLLNVIIVRDRREQQLTFTLPEHSQSGTESSPPPQTSKIAQQINSEMARLRPQLEMAMQQARQAANQIRESFDKEEFRQQVEEFRRQEQKQHQQLKMEMRKLHEKLSMGMNAI